MWTFIYLVSYLLPETSISTTSDHPPKSYIPMFLHNFSTVLIFQTEDCHFHLLFNYNPLLLVWIACFVFHTDLPLESSKFYFSYTFTILLYSMSLMSKLVQDMPMPIHLSKWMSCITSLLFFYSRSLIKKFYFSW